MLSVPVASLNEEGIDSERIILGSVLLEPELLLSLTVRGDDFGNRHNFIFDAMLAVFIATQSVDSGLVHIELRRRGQSWPSAATYISSLTDGVPRRVSLEAHCERVRQCGVRRKLARLCERTLAGCHDVTERPGELLERHCAAVAEIDRLKDAADNLGLVCGSDVAPEKTSFLITPYLPSGQLALLVGDPGSGKTFVSLSLAAGISVGRPPFSDPCKPQNVLYLSNEDSPSILRGRLDALGGDPGRIWFESPDRAIALSNHSGIEAVIKKYGAVLVIIDTLTTHFGAKVDFHKASDVATILSPLVAVAQNTNASVVGLMHLSKATQSNSLYRVQGSTAFAGAARSILAIGTDPSDPTSRVLTHLKSNGAAEGPSRRFTVSGEGLAWGEVTSLRAADVLRSESTSEDRSDLDQAMEFLREVLAQGSRDAAEVKAEAKEQGISERTLKRAKATLDVKSRKKSFGGGWFWWIDGCGDEEGQEGQQVGQVVPGLT